MGSNAKAPLVITLAMHRGSAPVGAVAALCLIAPAASEFRPHRGGGAYTPRRNAGHARRPTARSPVTPLATERFSRGLAWSGVGRRQRPR
jgi:hypothetical protein